MICLEAHGHILKRSNGTEEGRSYQKMYRSARATVLRWSRYYFRLEREAYFAESDLRLVQASIPENISEVPSDTDERAAIELGLLILPDSHQEDDLKQLDLRA